MWQACLLAVAGVLVAVVPGVEGQCKANFKNATFNLDQLRYGGGYKVIDDRSNSNSNNYTYHFNICGNLDEVPICPVGSPRGCCGTTEGSGIKSSAASPAFQVASPNGGWVPPDADRCHRLGARYAGGANSEWSLFDNTDPSKGVTLRYKGGDPCGAGVGNRSLAIHVLCADDSKNLPDKGETVLETKNCLYEITFASTWGCPTECPVNNHKLCSHHGICAFDSEIKKPRCFCNDGFHGEDCSATGSSAPRGLSAVGVLLIVISIFIAILLVFLYLLWSKIRSLRLDPQAYKRLTGGPGQDEEETGIYDE